MSSKLAPAGYEARMDHLHLILPNYCVIQYMHQVCWVHMKERNGWKKNLQFFWGIFKHRLNTFISSSTRIAWTQ